MGWAQAVGAKTVIRVVGVAGDLACFNVSVFLEDDFLGSFWLTYVCGQKLMLLTDLRRVG